MFLECFTKIRPIFKDFIFLQHLLEAAFVITTEARNFWRQKFEFGTLLFFLQNFCFFTMPKGKDPPRPRSRVWLSEAEKKSLKKKAQVKIIPNDEGTSFRLILSLTGFRAVFCVIVQKSGGGFFERLTFFAMTIIPSISTHSTLL